LISNRPLNHIIKFGRNFGQISMLGRILNWGKFGSGAPQLPEIVENQQRNRFPIWGSRFCPNSELGQIPSWGTTMSKVKYTAIRSFLFERLQNN
jgi:hypothetical protein